MAASDEATNNQDGAEDAVGQPERRLHTVPAARRVAFGTSKDRRKEAYKEFHVVKELELHGQDRDPGELAEVYQRHQRDKHIIKQAKGFLPPKPDKTAW